MIILIPAYEPDAALLDLVRSIRAADLDLAIVVIDDGSGPTYRNVFDGARALGCLVVGYRDNRGKGHALKVGFAFIAAEFPGHAVVCADSDGQHTVTDILRVAGRVEVGSGAMVLGIRQFVGAVPARSRFGNAATRLLFRLATGRRIHDTQTGLRGYPAGMLGWLQTVRGERYEYELNQLLQASNAGIAIDTVDIATIYLDENQSSHFRPIADSVRIYAPLLKFLLSSLAAFVVDTVALLMLSALTDSLLLGVVGARMISSVVNFAVNRNVVFEHARDKPLAVAAARYFGLVVGLLAVNFALLSALTTIGLPLLAAKLVAEVLLVAISYAVQHRFIFNRRRMTPALDHADRLARSG